RAAFSSVGATDHVFARFLTTSQLEAPGRAVLAWPGQGLRGEEPMARETIASSAACGTASAVAAPGLAASLAALGIAAGLWLGLAGMTRAQEAVTTSHGYSNFGALKYPADFAHLDYVNPEAPKGGERSEEHTSELQSGENLVCRLL